MEQELTIPELKAAQRNLAAAQERDRAGWVGLRRRDGQPVFAPAEQRERELGLRAQFNQALASVNGAIEQVRADAQRELEAIGAADPTRAFQPSELEMIHARTPLSLEDARRLSESQLEGRLRAALASGDKIERYVALRVGRTLRDERQERSEAERRARGATAAFGVSAMSQGLVSVLAELGACFVDTRRREAAEARMREADALAIEMALVRHLGDKAHGQAALRR